MDLKFDGPDKDVEMGAFAEVFRATYGAKLNLRCKRDRALYRAAKAIAEVCDIDAARREKARKKIGTHLRRVGKAQDGARA